MFRLAGAAFTTLDFSVSVIAPFCSAPVALVVSTNEAALAVPLATAVTGEEASLNTEANELATPMAVLYFCWL